MAQEATPEKMPEKHRALPARNRQRPFLLKKSQIRGFLAGLKASGRAEGTLKKYRSDLTRFFDFLGPEKWVYADSLPRWKQDMITAGYAGRSINASIVAVNSLYDYLGCWEWQLFDWMDLPEAETPELTRDQYHRLLQEARNQENIQLYLMVKLLGSTELTPGELPLVTREAVNDGAVTGKKRGGSETVPLPEALRLDLLDFAVHRGIRSGPVFLGSNGKPIDRTIVSKLIASLGEDACLPAGAANPRNLRRMYLETLAEFQEEARRWVARSYAQLLQAEEADWGWRIREDLGGTTS